MRIVGENGQDDEKVAEKCGVHFAAGFDGDLAKLLEGVGGGGHHKAAAAAVRMDRLHAVPDRELAAATTVRLQPNPDRWYDRRSEPSAILVKEAQSE